MSHLTIRVGIVTECPQNSKQSSTLHETGHHLDIQPHPAAAISMPRQTCRQPMPLTLIIERLSRLYPQSHFAGGFWQSTLECNLWEVRSGIKNRQFNHSVEKDYIPSPRRQILWSGTMLSTSLKSLPAHCPQNTSLRFCSHLSPYIPQLDVPPHQPCWQLNQVKMIKDRWSCREISTTTIKGNTTMSAVITSWESLTKWQTITFITNGSDELPWQVKMIKQE
jgi:hypothetical protein